MSDSGMKKVKPTKVFLAIMRPPGDLMPRMKLCCFLRENLQLQVSLMLSPWYSTDVLFSALM